MTDQTFEALIMIGRPASGKSEITDYLLHLPADERLRSYHIGDLDVIDDFPMLWTWFEEDAILSEILGQPRLHSDENNYFKHQYLWNLLIERIGMEYHKRLHDDSHYHDYTTTLVEFSRGNEHGGYRDAFGHLPDDLLDRAGVIYVNVSFEESLRKNRRRFNPERPYSILEHGLPDEKMERLYREVDWEDFRAGDPHFLPVRGMHIPYVVFENEDDVTTNTPDLLAARLDDVLNRLMKLKNE